MSETSAANDSIDLTELLSFEYTPLPSRCIRVLSPVMVDNAECLSWTISIVHLDDPMTDYEALSYVWGTPEETYPISCDGKSIRVHHNLFTALPYLARRGEQRPVKPIWIDAICINQLDEAEKRVQIGAMSQIYRRAYGVWVWLRLTNHQDRVPEAIEIFPQIVEAAASQRTNDRGGEGGGSGRHWFIF
jgi:hypothetical protein